MSNFFNKLNKTGKAKKYALIISAIIVLTAAIGGTVAWLNQSVSKTSSFSVGKIGSAVVQGNNGSVKIQNTDDSIDAYIRATMVMSWVDADGNTLAKEVKPSDYTQSFGSSMWLKGNDGYYYYKEKVAAGQSTENLLDSFVINSTPAGETLKIEVLASAIQASPTTAVESAWSAVTVDSSGNLVIK